MIDRGSLLSKPGHGIDRMAVFAHFEVKAGAGK